MKKTVLTVVVSFLVVFFLIVPTVTVFAGDSNGDVPQTTMGLESDYTVEDHGTYVYITGYTGTVSTLGTPGKLTIPSVLGGKPVTGLKGSAFSGYITSVTIPASIEYIEYNPFSDCHLTSITVDSANTHFKSSGGVLYNYGMTMLISYPYWKSGEYVMPASMTNIGYLALWNCSLTRVLLSDNITSINTNGDTFYNCNITSFAVNPANPHYECQNGVLYNKGKTVLVAYPPGGKNEMSFTIPDSVTSIGPGAFTSCYQLERITIPESVKCIGFSAFYHCSNLNTLTIPDGITEIAPYTFYGCVHLTGVSLPGTLTSIGEEAFSCCHLKSITIPDSVTAICSSAFLNCHALLAALFIGDKPNFQANVFDNTAPGFKVFYHISHEAGWSDYTDYPKQAYCIATLDPQNGGGVNQIIAVITEGHIDPPAAPVRTGYTFAGWYKEAECKNAWNFSTDNVTGDIALFAGWTVNTYTVSFDARGGIADPMSKATTYDSAYGELPTPSRTGYIFGGWYQNSGYTGSPVTSETVVKTASDHTLYAKWICSVTFDSQGGSAVASVTAPINSKITAPTQPTRTGYTIAGWYKDAACKHVWNFSKNKVTSNITLYAKWKINKYTVAFNSEGGSRVSSKKTNYNTTITAPKQPKRTGYTFAGWYREEGCINAWIFTSDIVTENIILYAQWSINTYTVSFNTEGGSAVVGTTAQYNNTITAPDPPSKTGYTFGGWYKEAKCKHAWNFSTNTVKTNTTLYAKWTINKYAVHFNSESGSVVADKTAKYNIKITAPKPPAKTGYTFDGWYKDEGYLNAWSFSTDKVTSEITLYAKWNSI